MAELNAEDKIDLNVLVQGDDPSTDTMTVTVPFQDRFLDLRQIIQRAYWETYETSIYGLKLYRANLPYEQAGDFSLSDKTPLSVGRLVVSEWPSRSEVDRALIHIIVGITSRRVTNTPRVIAPPPAETEFQKLVKKFDDSQDEFVQRVRRLRKSSSIASQAKNFRELQANVAYINNGRPADKLGLPIVLYHPVFGNFLTRLRSTDPIESEVYHRTRDHLPVSQDLYELETGHETAKDQVVRNSLRHLLGDLLHEIKVAGVQADGVIVGPDGTYLTILEMKNEVGTGSSDPSIQAAQSYTRYWSSQEAKRWLDWCCCPSILIGIAGPWMNILGAIFLDRPVIQPLTHSLWVGGDPARPLELDYISRVFDCARKAQDELRKYYSNSPSFPGKNTARQFPYLTHYLDSMGQRVRFAYRKSLCPDNPEKAIFLAERTDNENPIIVKFVKRYNGDAHRLLAQHKLAPELLYDGTMDPEGHVGPDSFMVVMELVQGVDLDSPRISDLPRSIFNDIERAVKLLHEHNIVFGDLREPNVMVLDDSAGSATGSAMLIDFDWCGKHGEGKYPLTMNLTLEWHPDVGLGKVMRKEHDIHMLNKLRSLFARSV